MDTMREKILWIKNVVEQKGMLDRYEFANGVREELLSFVSANKEKLRELSLRMVLKLADLRKSFPKTWKTLAATTCMKRA